ncbi:flagellin [Rhodoblastus sphagnicola]|nr:flagellin [Rhodoblastus sphagnicola]MBB4200784.1 flagellin [Rhodoblastus sphagnicola]
MYVSWSSASAQATSNTSAAQSSSQITQKQLSTGKSVSDSSENMALWAMATASYSQAGAVSTLSSSQQALTMPLAANTQSAIGAVSDTLNAMRDNLVALQGGGDQNAILQSLQAQGQALTSAVSGAGLNGVNLLDGSSGSQGSTFLLSYAENSDGGPQTDSVNVAAANLVNSGGSGTLQAAQAAGSSSTTNLTSLTASDVSTAKIAQTLSNLNAAQAQLQDVAASIGALSNMVDTANTSATTSQDNLANATAGMDNADMGAVAAQLSASQVQQQLSILAQGVANRSSANVLKLFQQSAG